MILRSIHRGATPVALTLFLAFGCTTVRAPASSMGDRPDGNGHQVELWLESGAPISEAEKAQAVDQVRSALDRATATLVSEDVETLLVVRAQGIARTDSRKSNQTAAKVGMVVGAAAIVAIVVVAVVAGGKGGGGGGIPKLGGAVKAAPVRAAPRVGGGFRAAPPRIAFPVSSGHPHRPAAQALVGVHLDVPAGQPAPLQAQVLDPMDAPIDPDERTAFPPAEPVSLDLPRPPPLDRASRKFFDKDFTRLQLLVVDRDTGRATWVKTVEGKVDPRDPRAVKALVAKAIAEGGWEAVGY
jgi:hypothetical protein